MTSLRKSLFSLFSLILGIFLFLLTYNFILWKHVIFSQIQSEPALGRDLTIQKYLTEGKFSQYATFVFGSSLALNGVNCRLMDETASALMGPCYNLGIPGNADSFSAYLEDIVKLKPKNIIWVADYQTTLLNPKVLDLCECTDVALPAKKKDFIYSSWDYQSFLIRWGYKNRLIDAVMRINKAKGYGDTKNDFKNPVFILGKGGLVDAAGIKDKDVQKIFGIDKLPQEIKDCEFMIKKIISYKRFIYERSPSTRMIILVYPLQPRVNQLLSSYGQFSSDEVYKRFMEKNQVLIIDLSKILTENNDWVDRIHASSEGVDKITQALLQKLKKEEE